MKTFFFKCKDITLFVGTRLQGGGGGGGGERERERESRQLTF